MFAAGYAWCAVSALCLLDRPSEQGATPHRSETLKRGVPNMSLLLKFLVYRQFEYLENANDSEDADTVNFVLPETLGELSLNDSTRCVGFNGRCNKVADTCYCWWVGGTLKVLEMDSSYTVGIACADICRCWAMSTSSTPYPPVVSL